MSGDIVYDEKWENLLTTLLNKIDEDPLDSVTYMDCFKSIKTYRKVSKSRAYWFNAELRERINKHMPGMIAADMKQAVSILRDSFKLESRDIFDSYLIYLEWDREPERRFYLPRRRVLKTVVDDLQDLEDRRIDFLGVSLPPRVGKSTLCIMFMSWIMGKHPMDASVMSGHSDKLTDGFYNEILNIITGEEYNWQKVFDDVLFVNKSSKNEQIDLDRRKRFPTLTCRSVNGTLTGAVEIGSNGLLYTDDLVEDLEESLNPERLQAKYEAYVNQLKDRKKDGAKELMVGTRWNVYDPLGRIHEQYEGNPRYRFTVIPALDENEESNFVYDYGLGFSTAYYLDMRQSTDDATWEAKYQGDPYVREGLALPTDELQYYNGVLPQGEADMVIAVCDVAWGGGDYLSMPVAYVFGNDVYIQDVAFSNQSKDVTQPLVVSKVRQHHMHNIRFEGNNGGQEYASRIEDMIRAENLHTNVTTRNAPNRASKLSRIIRFLPEMKRFHYIDREHASKEYNAFMKQVTTFVVNGKNTHDDGIDSLSQLAQAIADSCFTCTIFERPF